MTEQNPEKQPTRRKFSRRWLLAGLGATAVVTAGTAFAQEGTPTATELPGSLESLIASIAEKLGIEPDDLRQAVVEALQESGYDSSKASAGIAASKNGDAKVGGVDGCSSNRRQPT